ncbi:hypothetical protein C8R43DRAFT_941578 [Mycena crocata]|nr:hypothetical protein C8R43DRAFT_941578 [Mycena crocata]
MRYSTPNTEGYSGLKYFLVPLDTTLDLGWNGINSPPSTQTRAPKVVGFSRTRAIWYQYPAMHYLITHPPDFQSSTIDFGTTWSGQLWSGQVFSGRPNSGMYSVQLLTVNMSHKHLRFRLTWQRQRVCYSTLIIAKFLPPEAQTTGDDIQDLQDGPTSLCSLIATYWPGQLGRLDSESSRKKICFSFRRPVVNMRMVLQVLFYVCVKFTRGSQKCAVSYGKSLILDSFFVKDSALEVSFTTHLRTGD